MKQDDNTPTIMRAGKPLTANTVAVSQAFYEQHKHLSDEEIARLALEQAEQDKQQDDEQ